MDNARNLAAKAVIFLEGGVSVLILMDNARNPQVLNSLSAANGFSPHSNGQCS